MSKKLYFSILFSIGLIFAVMSFNPNDKSNAEKVVREENGTQYIHIMARAGYTPSQIQAKANMPTVLEVETKGTYDCSSSINIPRIGYRNALPPTGVTEIEIPQNMTTDTLNILCAMGMYRATVNFSS